jgi:AcrR family transcriptional regulator
MDIFPNEQPERRGRGRPQVRSDEETLQLILQVAGERFRADGYAGTSMSAVALGAGVSTKTLYRLVPNKEELFKQVVVDRVGRFMLEAKDTDGGQEDLLGDLERLLIAYGHLILDPETLAVYRLVVSECGRFPELGQAFYQDAVNRTTTYMAEWLGRRCQAGQIQLNDPRMAAGMLRGMMAQDPERSVLLCQASPPDAGQIAQRAKECARLFLEGCITR